MWLLNNLMFNLIWFCAIVWHNLALPLGLALLVWHCWHFKKQQEYKVILQVLVIGIAIDTALLNMGVFVFEGNGFVIPLWLMLIWAAFGATLNHSLAFLKSHQSVTYLIGFILPPLSYLAGARFGAVELGYSWQATFLILALIWSPLLYLLLRIADAKHPVTAHST